MSMDINQKDLCVVIWNNELSPDDMKALGDEAPPSPVITVASVQSRAESVALAKDVGGRAFRIGPEVVFAADGDRTKRERPPEGVTISAPDAGEDADTKKDDDDSAGE